MDPVIARKMWRTLEPYHGMIYFAEEAKDLDYFAARAAAMGAVPAEVVIATFFNFYPDFVRRSIPAAWAQRSPEDWVAARREAAGQSLRRILGAEGGDELREAAGLARRAAEACTPEGRPLYAGHASLEWPPEDEPLVALWHAIALLREYRGDGHIAALVAEGVDGPEALVIHGATGEVPPPVLQRTRAWPDDEWAAAEARVAERGWLAEDGTLTDAGRAHRDRVEAVTDEQALRPWRALGDEACDRLRALVRPWSKAISESGVFATVR